MLLVSACGKCSATQKVVLEVTAKQIRSVLKTMPKFGSCFARGHSFHWKDMKASRNEIFPPGDLTTVVLAKFKSQN